MLVLLVFVFCSLALAPTVETLTRVEQIAALPEQQTTSPPPFTGELIVTYTDRDSEVMFASDPTGSVFVRTDWALVPQSLEAGDSIRVSGSAEAIDVRRIINASSVAIIGSAPLPTPPVLLPTNPVSPRVLDAEFVTLDARIRHIYRAQQQFIIVASSGDLEFIIRSPQQPSPHTLRRLYHSPIRISGNLSFEHPAQGLPFTASLYTQDWETQCHTITPHDSPSLTDIVSFNDSTPEQSAHVRVTGTVTHVGADGNFLFADGDSTLHVTASKLLGLSRGQQLRLLGETTPPSQGGLPLLDPLILEQYENPVSGAPRAIDLDSPLNFSLSAGMTITAEGLIHSVKGRGTSGLVQFSLHGEFHRVDFSLPEDEVDEHIRHATAVRVTGTVVKVKHLDNHPGHHITLVTTVSTPPNVISCSPYSGNNDIAGFLTIAGVLITFAGLWVWTLKRQVHRRTLALSRSQSDLAAQSALLTATQNSVREGILVLDPQGHPLEMNRQFIAIFDLPANYPKKCPEDSNILLAISRQFADPEGFALSWNTHHSQPQASMTHQWKLVGEEITEIESFSAPVKNRSDEIIARVWVFRDLSREREFEHRLFQAQKMESVGRLAGGIAHDFNNIITAISGNLHVAKLNPQRTISESAQFIDNAEGAARRASHLVRQLLGFSRQTYLDLAALDPNESIKESLALIRASFDASFQFELDLDPSIQHAHLDSVQLEQVLLNLCVNARDAMRDGGTITISSRNRHAAKPGSGDLPGDMVEITVSDTGTGIAEEVSSHIFEPFYTTKEQGKGTGLGLAMSYGIIEQHGGWMSYESVVGKGTTFSVFLPASAAEPSLLPGITKQKTEKPTTLPLFSASSNRVLIIDDEPPVRAVAEHVFGNAGFSVTCADNGKHALEILAATSHSFDLVLLDLTMPVMSGKQTLPLLRELYPDLPVVICSGYLVDLDSFAEEAGARPDAFIPKPFAPSDLIALAHSLISPPHTQTELAATAASH